MKKKILALVLSIAMLSGALAGCEKCAEIEKTCKTESPESMFIEIEMTVNWMVVYDKETKVMYAVSDYGNGSGVFTLLVDENGNPKLWDGD